MKENTAITYEWGDVEGGHEEDEKCGLHSHGNLVGELIHDKSVQQSSYIRNVFNSFILKGIFPQIALSWK